MNVKMISSEIKSFADDSSIYGLRYLSISQRPWERTFWFIFMIISVVLSGLVVYTSLTDWKVTCLYLESLYNTIAIICSIHLTINIF